MTNRRVRRLTAILILLAPVGQVIADPPADLALKDKGLRKSGTAYVLPAESDVQSRLNAARSLHRSASAAAAQKREYEREIAAGQMEMRQMEQQLLVLNQSLAQGGLAPAQHNQLVGMINTLSLQLDAMRRQGSDDTRQVVAARLATGRERFIQAVLDLRQLVDETNRRYKELAGDAALKSAMEGLNAAQTGKTRLTLGPSRGYLDNVKQLERFEASVLTADVPLRREGGVYWVDVTFNGKLMRPMIFDTGASIVVLPSELAAQVGLTPGPEAPVVTARVADGSEVKAHMMVVPSLRVGKFTVENVECVVMPPSKKGVAPLLGQTFQRNFSIKFNPDAGKLVLSKVEAPEATTSASGGTARPKAATRSARGRRSGRGSSPAPDNGPEG
jgi:clan AA aspartic protease (TIGR02281 family)